MTEISTLPHRSRMLRHPTSALRPVWAAAIGGAVWLAQLLMVAADIGIRAPVSVDTEMPALACAAIGALLLAGVCRSGGLARIGLAAAAGACFGLAELAGVAVPLASRAGHSDLLPALAAIPPAFQGVALGAGALSLAMLASAEQAARDRFGIVIAAGLVTTAALLAHAAAMAGSQARNSDASGTMLVSALAFAGLAGVFVGLAARGRGMADQARSDRRDRFRVLAEALPIPFMLTDSECRDILFCNGCSERQIDLGSPALEGHGKQTVPFINPRDRERLLEAIRRNGSVEHHEVELRHPDGTGFWALAAARAVEFDGRQSLVATFHDITDRKAAEEALLASEVRYALISRASNDGIWDWDIPSGTVYYSSRWKEIVGAKGERLSSLEDWFSRVHPEDVARLREQIDAHIAGLTPQLDTEYRIRHGDGHYCWMQLRGIALRNGAGEPIRMAGSQSDISLRKTYESNLLNAAYEDRLTGISNRTYFTHLVDTRDNEVAIRGTAIILLNINQFRRLNDSFGSAAGDAMLIAIARRLAGRAQPQDTLSRLGDDEFAAWVNVEDHHAAKQLAESMLADLEQPYSLGEVVIPISLAVGIAAPTLGGAATGAELLRNARLALDRAKALGGGRAELFDDALLRETHMRRRLSRDLGNAQHAGQIFCDFQPIVRLEPGGRNRISGFEALMRWQHPEFGLIAPGRFIPLAEEAGLIAPLGLYAIGDVAAHLRQWDEAGLIADALTFSVNLSVRQIADRSGVKRLLETIERLALPHGRLKLEITESVLTSDPETMVTTLEELRRLGVALSLDDFGTGYSSLSYLHRFPLDTLKIDRSFISRMMHAPEAFRLVRSIIELAHDLGFDVVAEGVETRTEAEELRGLRCDYAQGYLFSRPVSAERVPELLTRAAL